MRNVAQFICSKNSLQYIGYLSKHNIVFGVSIRSIAMGSIVSRGKKGSLTINDTLREPFKGRSMESKNENIFEGIVCSESEIPNESAKTFDVDGNKILLAKSEGVIYAVGSQCTHYGLSLENGSVCKGRIRCPFHGACFSLKTGDIEDFPGLDSIPKFKVDVVNGKVKVTANLSSLSTKKRQKVMTKQESQNEKTFIIVGGGAAGAKCVETLRHEGFSGQIILLSSESAVPYDRPKLSKAMHLTAAKLALRPEDFYKEAGIDLKLGTSVVNVDSKLRRLTTSTGENFSYDKLFLATGGLPRQLSVPGSDLEGVFVLRNPTEANEIVQWVKGKKVVVIGSSFIGMEAAAYLSSDDRCSSVTVIGTSSVPFERSLGTVVGGRIQKLFEENGVSIINGARVSSLVGNSTVEKVIINDGEKIDAEAVIVGIGVVPSTDYLKKSEVKLDSSGNVCVNEKMETSVEGIYCGGDIAAFPLFLNPGQLTSIGHWQMSHQHGHVAALNMVGKDRSIHSVPFFWTSIFGKSFRYTGYGSFDDVIISGDLDGLSFIAYYCQKDKVVAVGSIGRAPAAAKYADFLLKGQYLTKQQVLDDGDVALKL